MPTLSFFYGIIVQMFAYDNQRHHQLKLDMQKFLSASVYQKLANIGFFLSVKYDARTIYWDNMRDVHIDQILGFGHIQPNPALETYR
jgi:hypothetical protein